MTEYLVFVILCIQFETYQSSPALYPGASFFFVFLFFTRAKGQGKDSQQLQGIKGLASCTKKEAPGYKEEPSLNEVYGIHRIRNNRQGISDHKPRETDQHFLGNRAQAVQFLWH